MADFCFDTSALVKRYHAEQGTPRVAELFAEAGTTLAISGLTVVEFHSTFAKKVRMGTLTENQFEALSKRFRVILSRNGCASYD